MKLSPNIGALEAVPHPDRLGPSSQKERKARNFTVWYGLPSLAENRHRFECYEGLKASISDMSFSYGYKSTSYKDVQKHNAEWNPKNWLQ